MEVIDQLAMCVVSLRDRHKIPHIGFLLSEGSRATYVVTTRETVRDLPSPAVVSISARSGPPIKLDLPAASWRLSDDPAADVAIAPLDLAPVAGQTAAVEILASWIAGPKTIQAASVGAGDEVVSPAIVPVSARSDQRRTVLRFGRISAMDQMPWTQMSADGSAHELEAILVDAPAWKNQSGSPVLVRPRGRFALLGLVSGPWRDPTGEVEGMVLVVPASRITDLLTLGTGARLEPAPDRGPTRDDFFGLLKRASTGGTRPD